MQTALTGNPQVASFDVPHDIDSDRDFYTAPQSFATEGFVTAPNSDPGDNLHIANTLKRLEFSEIEEYGQPIIRVTTQERLIYDDGYAPVEPHARVSFQVNENHGQRTSMAYSETQSVMTSIHPGDQKF